MNIKPKWLIWAGVVLIFLSLGIWAYVFETGVRMLACGFGDVCNLKFKNQTTYIIIGSVVPIMGLGFIIFGLVDRFRENKAKRLLENQTLTQK